MIARTAQHKSQSYGDVISECLTTLCDLDNEAKQD